MKKYMPLEGLRWSRDSGSALCDTSQNSRSRTGWGGNLSDIHRVTLFLRSTFYHLFPQRYNFILKQTRKSGESFEKNMVGYIKFPPSWGKITTITKSFSISVLQ